MNLRAKASGANLGLYDGLVERPVVSPRCRLHDGGEEALGVEQQRQVDHLHEKHTAETTAETTDSRSRRKPTKDR